MKKLYIIRHAKSSWDSSAKSDFDRPLNKRGLRDAPLMGQILKQKSIMPNLIISSSAKRAKKTAIILAEQLGYSESDILFVDDLYLASVGEISQIIQDVDNDIEKLFIIGHNPGMTEFINRFSDTFIDNLPTVGIFSMEIAINEWKALKPNLAKNSFFDYPKKHL